MELEITKEKEKTTIKLNNPKGREVKKGMKLLFAAQKLEDTGERLDKLDEFFEYVDEVSASNTGMSIEELDDLDCDEKTKIVEFYSKKIESRFDFLKSSLMQGS